MFFFKKKKKKERKREQIHQNLERTKEKEQKNIPLHLRFIPPKPSIRALYDLVRRFDREVKIRLNIGFGIKT